MVAASTLACCLGLFGIAMIPNASADTCVVTVTLLTGQTTSFTVNVPPGTPASSIPLPSLPGPVKSVSESCSAPPTTTTPPPRKTTPPPRKTSTTGSPSPSRTPHSGNGSGNHSSGSHSGSGNSTPKKGASKPTGSKSPTVKKLGSTPPNKTKPAPATGKGGVPTASNPTFSFALPGPAPIGVPNFFIDSFQIPPFLLPIYQAAGIEYDVPWQVLAAINEIETDYGRNLSVSSAGAVGWMQFLPSTWKSWGVDANNDGVADPYNPVDAIFTAARYLHAAGASKNLTQAVFAYNHASWYVQSVLLRAKLIGGIPDKLIGTLTGLVQGHFPVAAPAKYADNSVQKLAKQKVHSGNAAVPITSDNSKGVNIFAKQGSPAIAVNDGKVVKLGQNAQFGRYVELQDATGNIYTYAHLGQVSKQYPVPKPVRLSAKQLAKELSAPVTPKTIKPTAPASAGTQAASAPPSTAKATKEAKQAAPITLPVTPAPAAQSQPSQQTQAMAKERLFANPSRPSSYAAGGALQLKNDQAQISSFRNYFSDVLHLAKNQYTLKTLKPGSIVISGTILGRLAAPSSTQASHLTFMIQPAGKKAPYIDPKPILDGWKLLEATAVYRAAGVDPFFGPGAKNPTIGQVLLMSKQQLESRVLVDPHVQIYACGRRDIEVGSVDQRVLATIEFLSASGLDPTVTGLVCGHSASGKSGVDAAGATGDSVDISKINNIPIQGHQGPGSITDITIRRLLTLQGAMKPDEIVSTMSYKGQSNTLSLPDHANRIQVSFTPLFGQNNKLASQIKSILSAGQWAKLITRIGQIQEPVVPIAPSKYAIRTTRGR